MNNFENWICNAETVKEDPLLKGGLKIIEQINCARQDTIKKAESISNNIQKCQEKKKQSDTEERNLMGAIKEQKQRYASHRSNLGNLQKSLKDVEHKSFNVHKISISPQVEVNEIMEIMEETEKMAKTFEVSADEHLKKMKDRNLHLENFKKQLFDEIKIKEIKSIIESAKTLWNQISAIWNTIDGTDKEIQNDIEKNKNLEQELETVFEEIKHFENQRDEAREQVVSSRARISQLEVEKANLERNPYSSKINALIAEKNEKNELLNKKISLREDLELQIAQLSNRDFSEMEKEIEKYDNEIKDKEDDLEVTLIRKLTTLLEERKSIINEAQKKRQWNDLFMKIQEEKITVQKLKEELRDINGEMSVEELSEELDDKRLRCSELNDQLDSLKEQLAQLDEQEKKLKSKNGKVNTKNDDMAMPNANSMDVPLLTSTPLTAPMKRRTAKTKKRVSQNSDLNNTETNDTVRQGTKRRGVARKTRRGSK